MKKTDFAPEKLSAKVPESKLRGKKTGITPRRKERRRPIPRPNYTIEELLDKVPRTQSRSPKTRPFGRDRHRTTSG